MSRRIRSSRQIEYAVEHSVDFIWLTSGRKLEERGIELVSPVRQELAKADNPAYRENLTESVADADIPRLPINSSTKRFDKSAFVYDAETDLYYCPAGKVLNRVGKPEKIVIAGVETSRKNYVCRECVGCPVSDERSFKERT